MCGLGVPYTDMEEEEDNDQDHEPADNQGELVGSTLIKPWEGGQYCLTSFRKQRLH
jgi:hypothetical protein